MLTKGRCGSSVVILAALGLLVCADGTASAQVSTGGIRGIVRDATGAVLAGVTVEATSPARIGRPAVEVTNGQGLYRLEGLPIGVYTVVFTLQGFTTIRQETIRVEVGRSVELDQSLTVSAVAETVTVSGQSPVVDTVHAGTSTTFNQQLLDNIPSNRFSFFDTVLYAPAVQGDPNTTSVVFSLYGANSDQTSLEYDGLDIRAAQSGAAWDYPSFDIVQEVQVKSVGAGAEYSGFQGGAINIVTKSGTNAWKGGGLFFSSWGSLLANNQPEQKYPFHLDYYRDVNVDLGGPIHKDHFWVYSAYEASWNKTAAIGIPPQYSTEIAWKRPFVKGTFHAGANDISAIYQDSYYDYPYPGSPLVTPEATGINGGHTPTPRVSWTRILGARTVLEVKGGGLASALDHSTSQNGNPQVIDLSTGLTSGSYGNSNSNTQTVMNGSATLGHTANDFAGSHEFKFGVQYRYSRYANSTAVNQDTRFYTLQGQPYYALVRPQQAISGRTRTAGGFAQDNWTVTDRLTLNLGVRYDHTIGDVPPVDLLNPVTRESLGQSYPGLSNLVGFSDISPRIGATVKLGRSGKAVLKGFYGRFFGVLNANMFDQISPGNTVSQYFFYNASNGKYDVPYYTVNPNSNYAIDPNLTNQYSDQFYVGLEHEIMPDLGLDLQYVQRNEDNLMRLRDVGGSYAPRTVTDTFNGVTQALTVYNRVSPSSQSVYAVTNRSDLTDTVYRTAIVQATKRFSRRWQLQGSYQWQRGLGWTKGVIGAKGQNFSNLGPGGFGRDPNNLINAYGRMTTDATHVAKAAASYELPLQIHVGIRYLWQAGWPYGRIITVRGLAQGSQAVLAQPRGDYELPALNSLQARFDKDIAVGRNHKVRLSVDVTNLFNASTPLDAQTNSTQTAVPFGAPLVTVLPRQAMLGIRYSF